MSKPIRPTGFVDQSVPQLLPMQQDALEASTQAASALDLIIKQNITELQSWGGDIPSDQDMDKLHSIEQLRNATVAALNALKSIARGNPLTSVHAVPLCAYARAFSRLEDSDLKKIASPILSFVDRHRQVLGQASVLHGGRGYNNADNGHSR